ncbi:MAG TPA: helix-turn-helix transcriptional regulator [Caulobacteraceae bacterium]|nr:helix-turn-helix transcriptional regulator [Caulobacteraceae bacterium]
MADNSWRNLELWERVKWARSRRFESATAAASALGMKEGTYRCYERGPDTAKSIPLEYKHAKLFAREFKVRWEWLLDGIGEPWLTRPSDEEESRDELASGPGANLKNWREFRHMTRADLAKRAGTSTQVIADLESGAAELSDKWRNTLAPALGTKPGFLLSLDTNDVDPSFIDTFSAIPKEHRAQALAILKTFKPYRRLRDT